MEAWKKQSEYYAELGRPKDKSEEDRIARRVLNAVGYKNAEKGLAKYEEMYRGGEDKELPLWPRTRRMMYDMVRRVHGYDGADLDIQALVGVSEKELKARFAAALRTAASPVYLTLEDGSAYAYTLCLPTSLQDRTLPFAAFEGPEGSVIVRQAIRMFVRDRMEKH